MQITKRKFIESVGTFFSGEHSCTGYLSNKEELTTAAHCFSGKVSETLFVIKGKTVEIKGVTFLSKEADVAIFQVARQANHIPLGSLDHEKSLNLISYNINKQILQQVSCQSIDTPNSGALKHDCDTEPGNSGSPIIQNGKVVAIHIGTTIDQQLNIAIDLNKVVQANLTQINYNFEWSFKDLDPFNKTSAIRKAGRKMDPSS